MTVAYATPACMPIAEDWGNQEACLCMHGFGSAPGVYRILADQIRQAGYDFYAPLLTGHGTVPRDMRDVTAEQWQADCEQAAISLFDRYRRVHLIGTSMGGALCTYLAGAYSDSGKIGKVLLMVPGYALRNKGFYKIDFAHCGNTGFPLVRTEHIPPELEAVSFEYDFMYVRSIGQLIQLGQIGEDYVQRVSAPVWLLYAENDPVVDPEHCAEAARHFANLQMCHVYLESGHNILLGCERADVYQRVQDFLVAECL